MKNRIKIIAVAITLCGITAFSLFQNPQNCNKNKPIIVDLSEKDSIKSNSIANGSEVFYYVESRYKQKVTFENLKKANSISEIIPYFPSNWITNYVSVDISTVNNEQEITAVSHSNLLSEEQKSILDAAEISSVIHINVKYKSENAATGIIEIREMNVSLTVIPDKEAEYIGGYDQMIEYLKDNSIDELEASKVDLFQRLSIIFTVNEKGQTENIKLNNTSGDKEVDGLLMELIDKMPKWEPAQNADGQTVKQEFEFVFSLGSGMYGC